MPSTKKEEQPIFSSLVNLLYLKSYLKEYYFFIQTSDIMTLMRYLPMKIAQKIIVKLQEKDPFLSLLSQVMWHTGRRIGEVLSLTFSSIEIKEEEVVVHFPKEKVKQTKNRFRKTIAVAIPQKDWQEWMQILKILKAPSCRTYVFSLKKEIEKYSTLRTRYWRKIKLIVQENPQLEVYLLQENNCFHIWRHSYAHSLHNSGYALEDLRDALGHKSIVTTKEYYGNWYFNPARRYCNFSSITKDQSP